MYRRDQYLRDANWQARGHCRHDSAASTGLHFPADFSALSYLQRSNGTSSWAAEVLVLFQLITWVLSKLAKPVPRIPPKTLELLSRLVQCGECMDGISTLHYLSHHCTDDTDPCVHDIGRSNGDWTVAFWREYRQQDRVVVDACQIHSYDCFYLLIWTDFNSIKARFLFAQFCIQWVHHARISGFTVRTGKLRQIVDQGVLLLLHQHVEDVLIACSRWVITHQWVWIKQSNWKFYSVSSHLRHHRSGRHYVSLNRMKWLIQKRNWLWWCWTFYFVAFSSHFRNSSYMSRYTRRTALTSYSGRSIWLVKRGNVLFCLITRWVY